MVHFAARSDALAVQSAVVLLQSKEIGVDFTAKAYREILPYRTRLRLNRRLGEPLPGRSCDAARAIVPGTGDGAPGSVIGSQRSGLGAVEQIVIENGVVDQDRLDASSQQ